MDGVKTVADYREEKSFDRAWSAGRAERRIGIMKDRAGDFNNIRAQSGLMDAVNYVYSGEKFEGGWGLDRNYEIVDLPALRKRSLELWRSNPIANAIFSRLRGKVVNDGLHVEALPEAQFIGQQEGSDTLTAWTDRAEGYFHLYASDPMSVDERLRFNLYQLQGQAYDTAKLSGDCLVIRRIDPATMMPRIQLIDGMHIETPFNFFLGKNPDTGRDVVHGVEVDDRGREVGYWVRVRGFHPRIDVLENIKYRFVPAFGANSGRRVANLVYGSRLRVDEYRGMPLLGCCMQMLKQIDRTLDNAQLSAALDNAIILSVEKDPKAPRDVKDLISGGPVQKAAINTATKEVPQANGGTKDIDFKTFGNGVIFDQLAPGTKIASHHSRHPNPDVAKSALFAINLVGAAIECPPEILLLSFNNNFSASRQAVNEFDSIRRKEHSHFNPQFNEPIYEDVIIGLDISGRLPTPGLMDAIMRKDRTLFSAWTQSGWASTAELSVDMLKHINMFEKAIKLGLVTRTQIALKYFGTRFEKVVRKLGKENQMIVDSFKTMLALEPVNAAQGNDDLMQAVTDLKELVINLENNNGE